LRSNSVVLLSIPCAAGQGIHLAGAGKFLLTGKEFAARAGNGLSGLVHAFRSKRTTARMAGKSAILPVPSRRYYESWSTQGRAVGMAEIFISYKSERRKAAR
jgi:hypothetical protein